MKLIVLKVTVLAAWLGFMAWFVRYEAFPEFFLHALPGYRGIFDQGTLVMDEWMKITYQGRHIGYSNTRIDTSHEDPTQQYMIHNKTQLRLKIMGAAQEIDLTARAGLDSLYHLQQFYFVMTSDRYSIVLDGSRRQGTMFKVRIKTDFGTEWLNIDIPDDVIIHSPVIELAMQDMKPGQELRIRTMDPATMTVGDMLIRAIGRDEISFQGDMLDAMRYVMEYQGMEISAWMNGEGRIVRQETPFGWVMEQCEPEDALAYLQDDGDADDILRALAVPIAGTLDDPFEAKSLTLRFEGIRLPASQLNTFRQEASAIGPDRLEVHTRRQELPMHGAPIGTHPEEVAGYLAATPFIQSSHPDIVARAKAIVGEQTDSLLASHEIWKWVHRKMIRNPTVSIPSALDILHRLEGDCNEHAYLYVALARAAGIPSKVQVGLLYLDGLFYYHAWPAVYVGEWIDLDPTRDRFEASATHIALLEGELENQLQILSLVGKLKAEVVAQEY